jgi:hypothetical protein
LVDKGLEDGYRGSRQGMAGLADLLEDIGLECGRDGGIDGSTVVAALSPGIVLAVQVCQASANL